MRLISRGYPFDRRGGAEGAGKRFAVMVPMAAGSKANSALLGNPEPMLWTRRYLPRLP
jgi:hypothetical protein